MQGDIEDQGGYCKRIAVVLPSRRRRRSAGEGLARGAGSGTDLNPIIRTPPDSLPTSPISAKDNIF